MNVLQHLMNLAVILVLVMPIHVKGFSPARRVQRVFPKMNSSNSFGRKMTLKSSAAASSMELSSTKPRGDLNNFQATLVKFLMVAYIASMCLVLPASLFPIYLLHKANFISKVTKEKLSLKVVQYCSRWLMRIFPFASKTVVVDVDDNQVKNPQPTIWVCNHISMLDLFFVLALDKKMRGKNRRPIKVLYWRGLEANPITRIFCKMCGFIPVDMANNGNGNANQYDPKSFRPMLKSVKEAIDEGFDIGILPEGQPNPTPENGLQPVFSGAYTLARMSQRPIKMLGLYGIHHMWHPSDEIGMTCSERDMAVRVYPNGRMFKDAEEFTSTFENVVGYFGAHGKDLPEKELQMWLDGSMWQTELSRRKATRATVEDIEQEGERNRESIDRSASASVQTTA